MVQATLEAILDADSVMDLLQLIVLSYQLLLVMPMEKVTPVTTEYAWYHGHRDKTQEE
jgi:hypothetical protein